MKTKNRLADDSFNITTSIGCTTIERPPKSVSEILQKADKAMYAAKNEGRDRVHNC
ncbi:MAG: diguanylate cyclase [Betaproteobacteria bacterium]|nr:diguanylate cyclase [Betaproteobacteria bacterium]